MGREVKNEQIEGHLGEMQLQLELQMPWRGRDSDCVDFVHCVDFVLFFS